MYPSDMSDEQWEVVQKHFPAGKRAGRPGVRSAHHWQPVACTQEDGGDHVPGAAHPGTPSFVHFRKVSGQHLPLRVGHIAWVHGGILLFI